MKKLLSLLAILIIILAVGQTYNLLPKIDLEKYLKLPSNTSNLLPQTPIHEKQTVVYEESVITKVVEETLPSVVTVGIKKVVSSGGYIEINPFNPFSPFRQIPGKKEKVERNIGSGFIISKDGLIITNKHVVADSTADYQILTYDKKSYDVIKIYRDPLNDLAILKINTSNLKPLKLGDSNNLKLGQLVIAIGTPLGEFTNTVTQGIISGLGRGITAGSPFEGYVEKLDNVIQTDAAINLGNSGGPLLNSNGEVIGVNTAIASEGQNIGFAIPVNVVKNLIDDFQKRGGSFDRPYIGVRYKMIDKQTAILNDVVEGAYVIEVLDNSPAQKAEIEVEDIIIEFDGKKVKGDDDQSLAKMILDKKVGDKVGLKIWRGGKVLEKELTLASYNE